MKKLLVIGIGALLMGCATAPQVFKPADIAPVGLITVTASNDINWYGEQKQMGGILGNIISQKISDSTGENGMAILPVAEKAVRDALQAKNVEVIDPTKIQGSDAYLGAKEDLLTKTSGLVTPTGYRFVSSNDSGMMKKLATSTGLKTGLNVSFVFNKMISTGVEKNGVAKAAVTMNVVMVDVKGKAVLQKSYFGTSTGTFTIVAGVYKPDQLMALFPEAITAACDKFAATFAQ